MQIYQIQCAVKNHKRILTSRIIAPTDVMLGTINDPRYDRVKV
jgi:hypothetical protein